MTKREEIAALRQEVAELRAAVLALAARPLTVEVHYVAPAARRGPRPRTGVRSIPITDCGAP